MAGIQKLAVIIHRWGGSPSDDWYPWLKVELEARGYRVIVPAMPNADVPEITPWVQTLRTTLANNPAHEVLLVGHSIGCQAIIRYLAEAFVPVARALFVAGWVELMGLSGEEQVIAEPWLTDHINTAAAKAHLGSSVAFFSGDDPLVPLSNQDFFRDRLGSRIVMLDGYGHFDEGFNASEIPELLTYIEKG